MFSESRYSDDYVDERERSQKSLAFLKAMPEIDKRMRNMSSYMDSGFYDSKVRLSHQLSNLTSERVTTDVEENLERNPNSIIYLLDRISRYEKEQGVESGTLRIVSPYLFSGKFRNEEGELIYDGTSETLDWLKEHPDVRLEVITNSVLTGDNVFTQAIMETGSVKGDLAREQRSIYKTIRFLGLEYLM